jgi:deaminated glutathione amidase
MKKFRLALVQMQSSSDKNTNLSASIDYIKRAAKKSADLICFPEFQMAYSPATQTPRDLFDLAEDIKGNFITTLRKSAKEHNIATVATMYERVQSKRLNFRVSDTAAFISSNGLIKSVYRKLHLYDALGFKESIKLVSGNRIERPVKTSFGNFGLMICYDVRFPEMSRILTLMGAAILVMPSAWVSGIMKEEHWQIMTKSRAIENGVFIVAPNQIGNIYSGRSTVIDPFGAALIDMGTEEGLAIIEIDTSMIIRIRKALPLISNRRIDVYKSHIADLFAKA